MDPLFPFPPSRVPVGMQTRFFGQRGSAIMAPTFCLSCLAAVATSLPSNSLEGLELVAVISYLALFRAHGRATARNSIVLQAGYLLSSASSSIDFNSLSSS